MQNHRTPFFARRRALLGLVLASPLVAAAQEASELLDYAPRAKAPPGYTPAYADIVRAAEDEARLVIYSTADADVVRPLLADFRAMYPRISVEYDDLTSTELYHRYLAETQLGTESADVLWSSAMDLQASLVGRGYALAYASPEAAALLRLGALAGPRLGHQRRASGDRLPTASCCVQTRCRIRMPSSRSCWRPRPASCAAGSLPTISRSPAWASCWPPRTPGRGQLSGTWPPSWASSTPGTRRPPPPCCARSPAAP
ncbi:hypothetical protein ACTMU2_18530 [Cupriavidus basilensis]